MSEKKAPQAQAAEKLGELLHCGNERVELSAAKEILSMAEDMAEQEKLELEVTIRVIDGQEG